MTSKTYKVDGMHCTSCAMVIEGELEDFGIKASCNYARETLKVDFDENLVSEDKIIEVVKKAGYQAKPVLAN